MSETTLPEWAVKHFPKTPEEAKDWKPQQAHRALHRCVLAAAQTRIEGAWAAYIRDVPGMNHDNEFNNVLKEGDKLREDIARIMFPQFKGIPYAE